MPWRLIGLIAILAVLLAFIGVNLDNSCSISFGLARIENVPVYLTVFVSFVLGMLVSVPFLISFTRKQQGPRTPKRIKPDILPLETLDGPGEGPFGID
jgi:uncharacterized integral membrane protein